MRLGRLGGVEVRLDPVLAGLIVLSALAGFGVDMLLMLAAVLGHELGHLVWAEAEGLTVQRVVLHPLGGRAEIADLAWREPRAAWATAAAGPIASLVLAALAAALAHHPIPTPWGPLAADPTRTARFMDSNLWLAALNLLPVPPLDGGQVARAALGARWGDEVVAKRLAALGLGVGAAVAAGGWLRLSHDPTAWSWLVFGGWLMLVAARERRTVTYQRAIGPTQHTALLAQGAVLPGRILVAPESARVLTVLRHVGPRAYHVVCVTGSDGRVVGWVDEVGMAGALASYGPAVRLGEVCERRVPPTG